MPDVIRVVKYNARFGDKGLEAELIEESGDKFFLRITDCTGNSDYQLSRADVETFAKLFSMAIQPQ